MNQEPVRRSGRAPRVWRAGDPTLAVVPPPSLPDPPPIVPVEPVSVVPATVATNAEGEARDEPDPLTVYLARSFSGASGGVRYAAGDRIVYGGRLSAIAAPERYPELDVDAALPDRGAWEP